MKKTMIVNAVISLTLKKIPAIIAMLLVVQAVSCSKDKAATPAEQKTVTGFWKGTYGSGTLNNEYELSVLFRSNGSLRMYLGADTASAEKADGTYSVNGLVLNGTFKYLSGQQFFYEFQSATNNAVTQQTGKYKNISNPSSTFNFILNKQ